MSTVAAPQTLTDRSSSRKNDVHNNKSSISKNSISISSQAENSGTGKNNPKSNNEGPSLPLTLSRRPLTLRTNDKQKRRKSGLPVKSTLLKTTTTTTETETPVITTATRTMPSLLPTTPRSLLAAELSRRRSDAAAEEDSPGLVSLVSPPPSSSRRLSRRRSAVRAARVRFAAPAAPTALSVTATPIVPDAVSTAVPPPSTASSLSVISATPVRLDLSDMFGRAARKSTPPLVVEHHKSVQKLELSQSTTERPLVRKKLVAKKKVAPKKTPPVEPESWASAQEAAFVDFINQTCGLGTLDDDDDGSYSLLVRRQQHAQQVRVGRVFWDDNNGYRDDIFALVQDPKQPCAVVPITLNLSADVTLHRTLIDDILGGYRPTVLMVALDVTLGGHGSDDWRQRVHRQVLTDETLRPYQHRDALNRVVVYRILCLVVFLDGWGSRTENEAPLFTPQSLYKSSRQVLLALSRLLFGAADLPKVLRKRRIVLDYQQAPWQNTVTVPVKCLATDLRDGVVLARLAQEFTGTNLLPQLRLPAAGRLQKLHNIAVVLKVFGCDQETDTKPHRLVDGHRGAVLALLWKVLGRHALPQLLPITVVQAEIVRLHQLRKQRPEVSTNDQGNDWQQVLLDWVRVVVTRFRHAVPPVDWSHVNLDTVGLLVRYYHPTLLPTLFGETQVRRVCRSLGGIPHFQETTATPLHVACLCARLLSSCAQTRAARTLQRAWREQHRGHAEMEDPVQTVASRRLQQWWARARLRRQSDPPQPVVIQRWWRRILARRVAAAVVAQRIWRGWWAQLGFQMDLLDITMVQARVRGYLVRKQFMETLRAVRLVQSTVRVFLVQYHLAVVTRHAVCIQRSFRSYRVKQFQKRQAAAVSIQARSRGVATRCVLRIRSVATVRVQTVVRSWLQRRQFLGILTAIALLQRSLRHKRRLRLAAVTLQSLFRGWSSRHKFIQLLLSVRFVQQKWRRKRRIQKFCRLSAAIVIQVQWRRCQAMISFGQQVGAIVRLQGRVRVWVARQEAKSRRVATVRLQKCALVWLFRQRTIRQMLIPCRFPESQAALRVRKSWRRWQDRRRHRAAVVLQSVARHLFAVLHAHKRRRAVATLQQGLLSLWRNFRAQKIVHQLLALPCIDPIKATKLQSLWRGCHDRLCLSFRHSSASLVQSLFRGYQVRLDLSLTIVDAVCVQSVMRRWLAHQHVKRRKRAIVRVQSFGRTVLMRKLLQAYRLAHVQQQAALVLQRNFRIHRAQLVYRKEEAARSIQKTWRCYTVHIDYLLAVYASMDLQCWFRKIMALRKAQERLQSVIIVQSLVRTFLVQREQMKRQKSARTIQSLFSAMRHRQRFMGYRTSALSIQSMIRGYLVRAGLEMDRFAATEIQRVWRGFSDASMYTCQLIGAVKIQSFTRQLIARRIAGDKIFEREWLRQNTAAYILQRFFASLVSRATFGRMIKGFTRLQGLFRGFRRRRRMHPRLRKSRRRVEDANEKAKQNPQLQLGYRTHSALDQLLHTRSLSEIMLAVTVLELATRLSEKCCQSFVFADAPRVLFSLIRTCNRSIPHIELLHSILQAMWNVAQFENLVGALAPGKEVFLDLVQMFRDKQAVFCLATALLEQVCVFNDENQTFCGSKENLKRLQGVLALCNRKLSVVETGGSTRLAKSRDRGRHHNAWLERDADLRQGAESLRRVIHTLKQQQVVNNARESNIF